uniref:Ycf33 n=1 Tax=Anunuuluaehu liula TaxID=3049639 RepID=UPI003001786A
MNKIYHMNTFWDNISKFPRFLLSVIAGFFLTTLYPVFELLKDKKKRIFIIILSLLFIVIIYIIIKLMLGLN